LGFGGTRPQSLRREGVVKIEFRILIDRSDHAGVEMKEGIKNFYRIINGKILDRKQSPLRVDYLIWRND